MAQAKQDMGTGSIKKLMLQLMIPAVVAQVVNLLYNIVDRIYIGHIAGIGAAALTGVGLFTPILMLLNAFADDPESKVNACVGNVLKVWRDTEPQKGAQLVFCDRVAIRCYK